MHGWHWQLLREEEEKISPYPPRPRPYCRRLQHCIKTQAVTCCSRPRPAYSDLTSSQLFIYVHDLKKAYKSAKPLESNDKALFVR